MNKKSGDNPTVTPLGARELPKAPLTVTVPEQTASDNSHGFKLEVGSPRPGPTVTGPSIDLRQVEQDVFYLGAKPSLGI